jgi:hypothetical protein
VCFSLRIRLNSNILKTTTTFKTFFECDGEEIALNFMLIICDINAADNTVGHKQLKRGNQGEGRRQSFKGETVVK